MEQYSQSIIAILAVINPVVCGAMLLHIQKGKSLKTKIESAVKAMFIVLLILLVSALAGKYILNAFGISMEAFKIVGGVIIGFIGFQMMFGTNNSNTDNDGDISNLIMFAASPGTIAMVITLAAVNNGDYIPMPAIVGVVAAVLISLGIMILMLYMTRKKTATKQGFATKIMGLIIIAMGLQFILTGIKDFFGV